MCFYHAERIVFAIAKFLVHLFGEGRGGLKWEGRGRGRELGGKGRAQNANALKIDPKRN